MSHYFESLQIKFFKGEIDLIKRKTGMLYPTIEELTQKGESRYSLVIAAAKRARQIAAFATENDIVLVEKPVKSAISEIADGKVHIVESFEEEE